MPAPARLAAQTVFGTGGAGYRRERGLSTKRKLLYKALEPTLVLARLTTPQGVGGARHARREEGGSAGCALSHANRSTVAGGCAPHTSSVLRHGGNFNAMQRQLMSPARLAASRGAGGAEALGKTPRQRKPAVLEGNSAVFCRVPLPTSWATTTASRKLHTLHHAALLLHPTEHANHKVQIIDNEEVEVVFSAASMLRLRTLCGRWWLSCWVVFGMCW